MEINPLVTFVIKCLIITEKLKSTDTHTLMTVHYLYKNKFSKSVNLNFR